VVRRGQEPACPPPSQSASLRFKKNSVGILPSIQKLWRECAPAFSQQRVAERAEALSLSSLLCLGRHTVTGLLTTCGLEFEDWSADYRLFSEHRLPTIEIYSVIRRGVLHQLPPQAPFCAAIDDSLLRKTGIRIPGVAWRRDPLGPHFHTNFVRAQRVLQLSADLPLPAGNHRMVPIAFLHAPTPVKPAANASPDQRIQYKKDSRQARLPLLAAQQIASLRQSLNTEPDGATRPLHIFVDGGYTNSTVLKSLPANTTLVGRIRKDAKLYFLPEPSQAPRKPGRPLHYGADAPTPEQVRTDESIPWQKLPITINGVSHEMRVKVLANLQWRTAGLQHTLQLVVVAPLGYRLRKGSKLLYRKPAYLICTDPRLDRLALLQGFVQRWDIEVNFREEKTLLGVGEAQVRNPESVQELPAFQVASYAMLLLSMNRSPDSNANSLPPPKWASQAPPRQSTQNAINQLRGEVWGQALGLTNFSDLLISTPSITSPEKLLPHLPSAILYATNCAKMANLQGQAETPAPLGITYSTNKK